MAGGEIPIHGMEHPIIKICYLPGRETTYVRSRVLARGMEAAGLKVYHCGYSKKKMLRYLVGFFNFLKYKGQCDIILVGFFGQGLMPLVKLFTRKKIMFDAFVSAYQTLAFDRKSIKSDGFLAKIVRFAEEKSCRLADCVFLDTNQHINFFLNHYKLDGMKIYRLLVGADDRVTYPRDVPEDNPFTVHFHGEFQALHGAQYILEAARLLPEVNFRMIGRGKGLSQCIKLKKRYQLNNVTLMPPVIYEELPKYMATASVCLGIFGDTQKTQLVIPIKVYEALAMKRPIITADTPAIRELLMDGENVLLCKTADPKSLAAAIVRLKNDRALRIKISENGYKVFQKKCSPRILGEEIKQYAQQLLSAVKP